MKRRISSLGNINSESLDDILGIPSTSQIAALVRITEGGCPDDTIDNTKLTACPKCVGYDRCNNGEDVETWAEEELRRLKYKSG